MPHQDVCDSRSQPANEQQRQGQAIVAAGGSALDAVEAAVRILEDDAALNAGRGSFRNVAGNVEMDAMIMDGATLNLGAVAIVRDVCNPISLARQVMVRTEHTLLAGDGASRFADVIGFPRCDSSDWPSPESWLEPPQDPTVAVSDTVGAVARDLRGDLAAAVSTGGIPRKMSGRIGDSPLVGCGAYADNASAAVVATGNGEAIMKLVASKRICDEVARGRSVQAACELVVCELSDRLGASGGFVALDAGGRAGIAFNTSAMPRAWVDRNGRLGSSYSMP